MLILANCAKNREGNDYNFWGVELVGDLGSKSALIRHERSRAKKSLLLFRHDFYHKRISEKEYYAYLIHYAEQHHAAPDQTEHLRAYALYLQTFSRLDFPALLDEVNQLTHRVRMNLCQSSQEKSLIEQSQRLSLLKKLISLKATSEEVQEFTSNFPLPGGEGLGSAKQIGGSVRSSSGGEGVKKSPPHPALSRRGEENRM